MGLCSTSIRLCRRMSDSNTAVGLAVLLVIIGIAFIIAGIIWINCFLFTQEGGRLCEIGFGYFCLEMLSLILILSIVASCVADWRMTTIICAAFCFVVGVSYGFSYTNYLLMINGWLPNIDAPRNSPSVSGGFVWCLIELVCMIVLFLLGLGCFHCIGPDCDKLRKEKEIIDIENQAADAKRND